MASKVHGYASTARKKEMYEGRIQIEEGSIRIEKKPGEECTGSLRCGFRPSRLYYYNKPQHRADAEAKMTGKRNWYSLNPIRSTNGLPEPLQTSIASSSTDGSSSATTQTSTVTIDMAPVSNHTAYPNYILTSSVSTTQLPVSGTTSQTIDAPAAYAASSSSVIPASAKATAKQHMHGAQIHDSEKTGTCHSGNPRTGNQSRVGADAREHMHPVSPVNIRIAAKVALVEQISPGRHLSGSSSLAQGIASANIRHALSTSNNMHKDSCESQHSGNHTNPNHEKPGLLAHLDCGRVDEWFAYHMLGQRHEDDGDYQHDHGLYHEQVRSHHAHLQGLHHDFASWWAEWHGHTAETAGREEEQIQESARMQEERVDGVDHEAHSWIGSLGVHVAENFWAWGVEHIEVAGEQSESSATELTHVLHAEHFHGTTTAAHETDLEAAEIEGQDCNGWKHGFNTQAHGWWMYMLHMAETHAAQELQDILNPNGRSAWANMELGVHAYSLERFELPKAVVIHELPPYK